MTESTYKCQFCESSLTLHTSDNHNYLIIYFLSIPFNWRKKDNSYSFKFKTKIQCEPQLILNVKYLLDLKDMWRDKNYKNSTAQLINDYFQHFWVQSGNFSSFYCLLNDVQIKSFRTKHRTVALWAISDKLTTLSFI